MNIIRKSNNEFTMRDTYKLTRDPEGRSVRDIIGQSVDVSMWLIFTDDVTDRKTGELVTYEVLAFMTPEGEVYTTISPTFKSEFLAMDAMAEELNESFPAIKVISGTSTNGREYVTCTMA